MNQVMEKMTSPWKRRGLSPNRGKHIVQARTLVVIRESRVHPDIQLDTFVPLLQCDIFVPYITRCKGCAGNQRLAEEERHATQVSCEAEFLQVEND